MINTTGHKQSGMMTLLPEPTTQSPPSSATAGLGARAQPADRFERGSSSAATLPAALAMLSPQPARPASPGRRQQAALHSLSGSKSVEDAPYEKDKTYKVTVLHTNDSHGHYWKNKKGEFGFAAQKTLVDRIRKEVSEQGGHTLLLSGGDINTGDPRSDLLNAEPDFRGMNELGYTCMAIGNHEFDKPNSVLETQEEIAEFPFLGANIYKKGSTEHGFQSTLIKNLGGLKVGILGLITEDTKTMANPESTRPFFFRSAIKEAADMVPRLKKETGLVIALTHLGHYGDAKHGTRAPGDESLARNVDGIDVIVGGHTQITLNEPDVEGKTLIVQAGEWGEYLGRLDLEVLNGEIVDYKYNLIPINKKKKVKDENGETVLGEDGKPVYEFVDAEIPEDQGMLDILKPFYDFGGEKLEVVVGSTETMLYGRPAQLERETNLGRLIATSQNKITGSQIGIINNGGIRANIEPGDITYEDVLEVMPFGNSLCTFDLTGPALKGYLETLFQEDILHLAGVEITKDHDAIVEMKVNGEKVVLEDGAPGADKTYKVSLNNYSANGGSGWPDQSKNPTFVDTGFNDAFGVKEFLEKSGGVTSANYQTPSVVDISSEDSAPHADQALAASL